MLKINLKEARELSKTHFEQYQKEGIVYVEGFYDFNTEILPIQKDIYKLISLIIKEHQLPIRQEEFSSENFDSGLQEMHKIDRKLVGVLYDAVKKIPSYLSLANSPKHIEVARKLINSDFVGFAPRGYGMRMDNPSEDLYLTQWHQDYVSQLCSPKGVVLWSPLRKVTREVGPVVMCPNSHKDGVFPIIKDAEGSYGLRIKNEEEVVARYPFITPEVDVGALVIIDYLTLHCSSPNRSKHTRWAMISRYFDFLDKTGSSYGWKGGLQEGGSFEKIHPELSEVINDSVQT